MRKVVWGIVLLVLCSSLTLADCEGGPAGSPVDFSWSGPWTIDSPNKETHIRIDGMSPGFYRTATIEFDYKTGDSVNPSFPIFGMMRQRITSEPNGYYWFWQGEHGQATADFVQFGYEGTKHFGFGMRMQPNTQYRVVAVYNAETSTLDVSVPGLGAGSGAVKLFHPDIEEHGGMYVWFGDMCDSCPKNHPLGATYSNLRVTMDPGGPYCNGIDGGGETGESGHGEGEGFGGEKGTLNLNDGTGFTPDEEGEGEEIEILVQDGLFFTQPWDLETGQGVTCGESSPTCGAEKWFDLGTREGASWEKITVGFDFKTHDLDPSGWLQYLVELRNQCSGERFWRYEAKHPGFGTPGMSMLDARGYDDHNTWLKGDYDFTPMTTYRAEITWDVRDEETYIKLFDSGGELIHTVGGKINTNGDNIGKVEHTMDGFDLKFGMYRSFPNKITGQPHLWEFSNLKVTGVALSGDPLDGPGGSDLGSEEGQLAFLAAHMLQAPESDYQMECGPAVEVLPIPPQGDAASSYCVLIQGDDRIFGTFSSQGGDNSSNPEQEVLESFIDEAYALHIDASDISVDACDSIDTTLQEFQKCNGAIDGMHTYAYVDISSGTSFLLISDEAIEAFDGGLIDGIVDWFKNLFGIGGDDEQFIGDTIQVRRFHHGYFSTEEDRTVVGTWVDGEATISYENFVTNVSTIVPEQGETALAKSKQVLVLDIDSDDTDDVHTWRRFTSSLRIEDIPGDPIEGGSCGDGVIGVDEECEPDIPLGTCEELYDGLFTGGNASCHPPGSPEECTIDVNACLGGQGADGCFDDWEAGPSPNICPGDPACGSGEGGGEGDGGDHGGGDHGGGDHGGGEVCGNGEIDNGESCVNCPHDVGACPYQESCPTPWLYATLHPTGAYIFEARSNAQGQKEVRLVEGPLPPDAHAEVCFGPGGGADTFVYNGQGIVYKEGTVGATLYHRTRNKACSFGFFLIDPLCELVSDDKHWDTKILYDTIGGEFHIYGTSDGVQVENEEAGGVKCWDCGADKYCTNVDIRIPIANIQTCGDGGSGNTEYSCSDGVDNDGDTLVDCQDSDCAAQCAGQCTGANGCCLWNEPCSQSTDCCGDGHFLFCGVDNVCEVEFTPPRCFVAGTPVLTPDGERAIEDIAVGDAVLISADDTTTSVVKDTIFKEATELVHVTPEGMDTLSSTPQHPYWTERGWTEAGDLVVGDVLQHVDGSSVVVVDIQYETLDEPVPVYDLHIEHEAHNYYAGGVLVHNKEPLDPLPE